jgi:hypothetical protein
LPDSLSNTNSEGAEKYLQYVVKDIVAPDGTKPKIASKVLNPYRTNGVQIVNRNAVLYTCSVSNSRYGMIPEEANSNIPTDSFCNDNDCPGTTR